MGKSSASIVDPVPFPFACDFCTFREKRKCSEKITAVPQWIVKALKRQQRVRHGTAREVGEHLGMCHATFRAEPSLLVPYRTVEIKFVAINCREDKVKSVFLWRKSLASGADLFCSVLLLFFVFVPTKTSRRTFTDVLCSVLLAYPSFYRYPFHETAQDNTPWQYETLRRLTPPTTKSKCVSVSGTKKTNTCALSASKLDQRQVMRKGMRKLLLRQGSAAFHGG